jgi:GTP-binding protein Era
MMNKSVIRVLHDVDAVVMMVDSTMLHDDDDDDDVFKLLTYVTVPCFLVLNKVDKFQDKAALLPLMQVLSQRHDFKAIIPLSAKTGDQVEELKQCLRQVMPEGPFLFDADQLTDRSLRFLCAELVREKIFRLCGQELPYSTTVSIESYQDEDTLVTMHALIWVEKESHKRMIIGNKGSKMKEMATLARVDMERLVGKKVFLQCFCKVKSGWSDNEPILKQLGYDN